MKKIKTLKTIKLFSEICIIIGSVLSLLSGTLLFMTIDYFFFIASGFFIGIMLVIIGGAMFTSLRNKVYTMIVPSYFDAHINHLTYNPFRGISSYQVAMSEHLKKADDFKSQNLFTGSIQQCPFILSHVIIKQITNQKTKKMTPIFNGSIYIFDVNQSFNARIHLLTTGYPLTYKNYQKIESINNTLDDAFTCYTTSKTKAKDVMNNYMTQTINKLKARHPHINVSFLDKKLFITMDDSVKAFSVKLFKKSHLERLETFKEDLFILKELVIASHIN